MYGITMRHQKVYRKRKAGWDEGFILLASDRALSHTQLALWGNAEALKTYKTRML